MSDAIFIHTSVGGMDAASALGELLVDAKLAACVQIVPGVKSIYRWKGTVHRDDEVNLIVKAPATNFDAIAALLREHHPYELPEIVAVRIERGSADYLGWIAAATESGDPP
jgi:periplasmic divalent cation tolerance protein